MTVVVKLTWSSYNEVLTSCLYFRIRRTENFVSYDVTLRASREISIHNQDSIESTITTQRIENEHGETAVYLTNPYIECPHYASVLLWFITIIRVVVIVIWIILNPPTAYEVLLSSRVLLVADRSVSIHPTLPQNNNNNNHWITAALSAKNSTTKIQWIEHLLATTDTPRKAIFTQKL